MLRSAAHPCRHIPPTPNPSTQCIAESRRILELEEKEGFCRWAQEQAMEEKRMQGWGKKRKALWEQNALRTAEDGKRARLNAVGWHMEGATAEGAAAADGGAGAAGGAA